MSGKTRKPTKYARRIRRSDIVDKAVASIALPNPFHGYYNIEIQSENKCIDHLEQWFPTGVPRNLEIN